MAKSSVQHKVGTRPTTLQHRVEAMLARSVFGLLGAMKLEHASALGGWLVETILPFTKRGARARQQIAVVFPELSPADVKRMERASWNVFGRSMAELPHLQDIVSDPSRLIIENPDVWATVNQSPKGTIYVASHMGNWELLPGIAKSAGQTFKGFYRPLSNAILDERLLAMRQITAGDGGLLPAASRGISQAIAALRRGEFVGILGDLFEGHGVAGTFLGLPAHTNSLPATLSLRCDAQIVIATVTRLPGVRFKITFSQLETVVTGDRAHDISATTEAMNRELEAAIMANADQWLWSTNRWKGLDLTQFSADRTRT